MSFYNLLITITWVDFRSDWALCCCCRCTFAHIKLCCRYVSTTLSNRKHPLRCRVSGQQMFFARKRSDSSRMLVTKALSQDVMVLAFVPLSLIPEESPSLHSNQLIHMAYVLAKCHLPLVIS